MCEEQCTKTNIYIYMYIIIINIATFKKKRTKYKYYSARRGRWKENNLKRNMRVTISKTLL